MDLLIFWKGVSFVTRSKIVFSFRRSRKINFSLLASQNRYVRLQRQKFSIYIARIFFLTCTFQSQNIFTRFSGQDFIFLKRITLPCISNGHPPPPRLPKLIFATWHTYKVPHRSKPMHFTVQCRIGNTPCHKRG